MKRPLALAIILSCYAGVYSADWPAWRGPDGQGHCAEKHLPLKWSKTENVKWKVPLAEPGNSTPIVWGDKIFLTQANTGGSVRSLLCFAKADGKLLWQRDTAYAEVEACFKPNY
jgi:outer membrane protein assembly factor BamB